MERATAGQWIMSSAQTEPRLVCICAIAILWLIAGYELRRRRGLMAETPPLHDRLALALTPAVERACLIGP
jgi:hypothetical protein